MNQHMAKSCQNDVLAEKITAVLCTDTPIGDDCWPKTFVKELMQLELFDTGFSEEIKILHDILSLSNTDDQSMETEWLNKLRVYFDDETKHLYKSVKHSGLCMNQMRVINCILGVRANDGSMGGAVLELAKYLESVEAPPVSEIAGPAALQDLMNKASVVKQLRCKIVANTSHEFQQQHDKVLIMATAKLKEFVSYPEHVGNHNLLKECIRIIESNNHSTKDATSKLLAFANNVGEIFGSAETTGLKSIGTKAECAEFDSCSSSWVDLINLIAEALKQINSVGMTAFAHESIHDMFVNCNVLKGCDCADPKFKDSSIPLSM